MNEQEKLIELEATIAKLSANEVQLNRYVNESLDNLRQAVAALIDASGLSFTQKDRIRNLISKETAMKNVPKQSSPD